MVELERLEDGKRRQKWLSDPSWVSKKAAEKDLPRVLFEASRGVFSVGPVLEVSELLDKWHHYALGNIRPSSARSYRWAIAHAKAALGNKPINRVTPLQIQSIMQSKLEGGLSNTSARLVFAVLNRAFNQAVIWGLLASNPCAQIARPKPAKFETIVYNGQQLRALIEAAKGSPGYLAIYLAVACGMRRGEVCALRWQDVDLARKTLHISHTVYESHGISPVKTAKSNRAILMPDGLVEAMHAQKAAQQAHKEADGAGYVDRGFVVAREDGQHYNPAFIYQQFRRVAKACGLPAARFHDLRHSHATYLLSAGVPIKAVSERLGHSSTAFTMDRYAKVLQTMQEQAAGAMNSLFE